LCFGSLAVGFRQPFNLLFDDAPATDGFFLIQKPLDFFRPLAALSQLVGDEIDLQPGQAIQLEFENIVDLLGIQAIIFGFARPMRIDAIFFQNPRGGIRLPIAAADDLDQIVENVERECEAFEGMNALAKLLQLIGNAAWSPHPNGSAESARESPSAPADPAGKPRGCQSESGRSNSR